MTTKNENLILGMLPSNVPNLISRSGFAQVTVYRLLANLIRSNLAYKQIVMLNGKCHYYDYLLGTKPEIKQVKINEVVTNKNIFKLQPLVEEPIIIKHHQLMCMFGINV